MNFWNKLKKPFFVLAPMADVTDQAFRRLIAKYGKPGVTWTEFVSADGLAHPIAREKLLVDLAYTEAERPIVAQLFGSHCDNMREAAKLCVELGFDGVDLNMGCPDKSIEKQGAGAASIKNKEHSVEVIKAARAGAGALPVSVKTRLGYNKVDWEWIEMLLGLHLPVLTVHLRTRKEMSLVPAHWELMPQIVALRDKISPETLIIGNGDAKDINDARIKIKESGCDGVMLGRAIFGNPWLFDDAHDEESFAKELTQKLTVMVEHTKLFEKLLGGVKNFAIMKKHYKAYVNGFEGAKELRQKLFDEAHTATDVENIVNDFLLTNKV